MKEFWLLYGFGLLYLFETNGLWTSVRRWFDGFWRPLYVRGGVALAGLHAIWAVIDLYLSR